MDLIKNIDEYYDGQVRPPKERDYFYISEAGNSKKELYDALKYQKQKKFDSRVKRILENGNYMHHRYMKIFAEMRILIAAEITVVENDLVHGRADCILTDNGKLYVLDLKSCSMWTFKKLAAPVYNHEIQLQFYMYFLNISQGKILYENKDNQAIRIFDLELDKEMVEKELERMREIKSAIEKGEEVEEEKIEVEKLVYGV